MLRTRLKLPTLNSFARNLMADNVFYSVKLEDLYREHWLGP